MSHVKSMEVGLKRNIRFMIPLIILLLSNLRQIQKLVLVVSMYYI